MIEQRSRPRSSYYSFIEIDPRIIAGMFVLEVLSQKGVYERIRGKPMLDSPIIVNVQRQRWQLNVRINHEGPEIKEISLTKGGQIATLYTERIVNLETGGSDEFIIGYALNGAIPCKTPPREKLEDVVYGLRDERAEKAKRS